MKQLRFYSLLIAIACFGTAMLGSCTKEKSDKDDDDDNNNSYKVEYSANELNGTWAGYEVGREIYWEMTFQDDSFGYFTGGSEVYSGTYRVTDSSDIRKCEFTITSSSHEPYIGEKAYGIYMYTGLNKIKLAGKEPGKEGYPTFVASEEDRIFELEKQ